MSFTYIVDDKIFATEELAWTSVLHPTQNVELVLMHYSCMIWSTIDAFFRLLVPYEYISQRMIVVFGKFVHLLDLSVENLVSDTHVFRMPNTPNAYTLGLS